eukprot:m51a1_g10085 hypothetical protein (1253) ;mRNA; f:70462-75865
MGRLKSLAEDEGRRAVERDAVQGQAGASRVRVDQARALVSGHWWAHWTAYAGYPGADPLLDLPRPGPIDNSSLLTASGALAPGLVEGHDLFAVPLSVWRYLHSLYGGGPPLVRLYVPYGALHAPRLELYPLVLFARLSGRASGAGETLLLFLMSPHETLRDLRRYLGVRSGMAPHRLEVAAGASEYGSSGEGRWFAEADMDRTLGELGIRSNTFFFVDPARPGHYVWSSSSRVRNGVVGDQDVMLEYTADLAEGVHSLDVEQSIDTLSCSADHIVVGVTSDEALRGWGQSFVVVADRRWGCDEGTVIRQVTGVHWLSPTSARLSTQSSSYAGVFTNASIHLSATASSSQPQPLVARGPHRAPTETARVGYSATSPGVVVRSPAFGDQYSSGDMVTVEWTAPNVEGHTWTLKIYEGSTLLLTDSDYPAQRRWAAVRLPNGPSSSRWYVFVGYYCLGTWCSYSGMSNKFSVNFEPSVGFVRPASGELFSEGNEVRVQWAYRRDLEGQVVAVSLWRCIDWYPDTQVGQRTVVNIGRGSLTWIVGSDWKESDRYFAYMEYGCESDGGNCKSELYGQFWTVAKVRTEGKHVDITEPSERTSAKSPGTLMLSWEPSQMGPNDDVEFFLMFSRTGTDKSYGSLGHFSASACHAVVSIPEEVGSGTEFYVRSSYDCGTVWCLHTESKRFSINYSPVFQLRPPTPSTGDILEVGQPVTIAWDVPASMASAPVIVALRLNYPSIYIFDPYYDTDSVSTTIAASTGSWSYVPQQGTVFPVYWTIWYDCKIGNYWCKSEHSHPFFVPNSMKPTWNYNGVGGALEKTVEFSEDCARCSRSGNSSAGLWCALCGSGVDLHATTKCTDCWAAAAITAHDFNLEIGGSQIASVSLKSHGTATVNLGEFVASVGAEYSGTTEMAEVVPTPLSVGFHVGPISFYLGLVIRLGVDVDYEARAPPMSGSADVTVGYSHTLDYTAEMQYGTAWTSSLMRSNSSAGSTPTTTSITASGALAVRVATQLEVAVTASSIAELAVWARPTVSTEANVSYPAFGPAPNPPVPGTLLQLGNCSGYHMVEYLGTFTLPVGGHAALLVPGLERAWQVEAETVDAIHIVGGCLLQLTAPDPLGPYYVLLVEDIGRLLAGVEGRALAAGLASGIAGAVGAPPSVVNVSFDNATAMAVRFRVSGAGREAELTRSLDRQLGNLSSSLYAAPLWKSLRGSVEVGTTSVSEGVPDDDGADSGTGTGAATGLAAALWGVACSLVVAAT